MRQSSALRAATEIFFGNEYGMMDVKGKTVLDIGCSDGDTAVYFLLKGAKNVIGYDTYPEYGEFFNNTMKINAMEDQAIFFAEEVKSLGDEIRRHHLKNACLKMDCEGAEYPLLEKATDRELMAFDEIIMEYHREPEPLRNRLEKAGFTVKIAEGKLIMHAWRNAVTGPRR